MQNNKQSEGKQLLEIDIMMMSKQHLRKTFSSFYSVKWKNQHFQ